MATYNVTGITFKQLSPMQNRVLWAMFKLNWLGTMDNLSTFVDRAKGTVIPHARAMVKKGFLDEWKVGNRLVFWPKTWVKGEIRKAINREFPYQKVVRRSNGSRSYVE